MAGAPVFTDAVGAVHPRGAWYMAGWDDDLAPGALHAISDPRRAARAVPRGRRHRRVRGPLPAPRRAAFARALRGRDAALHVPRRALRRGRPCVEVPGQDTLPPQLKVRTYPALERHSALWVWMGDPAQADEAAIPPFVGHRDPAWALGTGRVDYDAPARLIHDNLLDLTHICLRPRRKLRRRQPGLGRWLARRAGRHPLARTRRERRAQHGRDAAQPRRRWRRGRKRRRVELLRLPDPRRVHPDDRTLRARHDGPGRPGALPAKPTCSRPSPARR